MSPYQFRQFSIIHSAVSAEDVMQERVKNCVTQVIAESAGTRGEGAYLIDVKVKGKGSGRKIEVLLG